jgi:predicted dehydrogenase
MNKLLRWGILGTGNAANVLAAAIKASSSGQLVAVASRDAEVARKFSEKHQVCKSYGSYEDLLNDSEIDVVCIALPHNLHAEWSIKAAQAKKHILCEKPAAINYGSALAVIDEVKKQNVFYMEGFMYRCHKQTKKLIEILKDKEIGQVKLIEASFCYHAVYNAEEIARKKISGGGGILDVGCYPVSMARLIAGIENNVEAIMPLEVQGMAHIGDESAYDEWAVANLKFQGDILAQVSTSVSVEHRNDLRIFGSEGSIYIPSPWVPGGAGPGITSIFIKYTGNREIKEIKVETSIGLYAQEIDTVVENIQFKEAKEMNWQDTLCNMKTIELWRNAVGIQSVSDSCKCQN